MNLEEEGCDQKPASPFGIVYSAADQMFGEDAFDHDFQLIRAKRFHFEPSFLERQTQSLPRFEEVERSQRLELLRDPVKSDTFFTNASPNLQQLRGSQPQSSEGRRL